MTDRIRTLTVVLDRDMRDDDVEVVKSAIGMIKCVASIENGPAVDYQDHMNRDIARSELETVLLKALRDDKERKR